MLITTLELEEISRYLPRPVKMVRSAGLGEIKLVGSVILICGILILCLAVPTTCMLPYAEYVFIHAHNYVIPLWLIYVGGLTLTTASDIESANWMHPETGDPFSIIPHGPRMKQLMLRMTGALALIAEGFGDILNDPCQGPFHQVLKQIRCGKWGDLNPTKSELQALEAMYGIINIVYVVARMALVFGMILATVIWIHRATVSHIQKDGEVPVAMKNGDGREGESVKMLAV